MMDIGRLKIGFPSIIIASMEQYFRIMESKSSTQSLDLTCKGVKYEAFQGMSSDILKPIRVGLACKFGAPTSRISLKAEVFSSLLFETVSGIIFASYTQIYIYMYRIHQ